LEASNGLSPGGAWPDPTEVGLPAGDLNVTVPPGLDCDLAGCHWLAVVPSIVSLRLA
jgi:hypothetical protein